jgi:hypothetical protein
MSNMPHPQKFGPFRVAIQPGQQWDVKAQAWIDVPGESGDVTVEVDFAELVRVLGRRALRSTGGKAIEASGMVVVRKVRR